MKQSEKKISIIIPCYNGENFVNRCMSSIIIQDYSKVECIVVDDGSVDSSKDKILRWKEQFKQKGWDLIYFYQENQGVGAAINAGLKLVTGDYIILLDIDDEYLPGALKEKAAFLDSNRESYVVRSNGWMVNGENRYLFITDKKEKQIEDVFMALVSGKTNNWAGSYMVRADKLFAFYPEREIYLSRYGQNLQLLLPLLYHRKCGYIDKPHMNYIRQVNSLSKTTNQSIAEKKSLENIAGYTDIRIHMVELIVQDKLEKNEVLKQIDKAHWRAVMQIAADNKNKSLMEKSYKLLKKIDKPTIDDRIIYMAFKYPQFVLLMKVIRRIKRMLFRS